MCFLNWFFTPWGDFPFAAPCNLNEAVKVFLQGLDEQARNELGSLKRSWLPDYEQVYKEYCIKSLGLDGSNAALIANLECRTVDEAVHMVFVRAWFRVRQQKKKTVLH